METRLSGLEAKSNLTDGKLSENFESISGLSESIKRINESLSQEIGARQKGIEDARTELKGLIDTRLEAEKASRGLLEKAMKGKVEAEAKDHEEADSRLETKLLRLKSQVHWLPSIIRRRTRC